MATRKKAPEMTAQDLLSRYTDYVLEQERKPSSVFKFCKDIGIEEADFYRCFASFEMLEAAFFVAVHKHTLSLLQQDTAYSTYPDAHQLLSYYYTFFEMATANRSYILLTLKGAGNPIESLVQLKELRSDFLLFASGLLVERQMIPGEKFRKAEGIILQESAWVQFLFILKFWMRDTSPNFEKTDVMIEKSVKASFDILDQFPLKSVIDLGKFLWKERPF